MIKTDLKVCAQIKKLESGEILITPLDLNLQDVIFAYSNIDIHSGEANFDVSVLTSGKIGNRTILKDYEYDIDQHKDHLVKLYIQKCFEELINFLSNN